MNYSKIYFGIDRESLSYTTLESFFEEPKDENDSIEFKSYDKRGDLDSKFEGICKSLCAFLNSNGGLLIWGSPKGDKPTGKKEKIFQGALTPLDQILEKDTLIRIVSSRISPISNTINVKIIKKDNSCICIFEVQKSISAHQLNGTYYMRIDGQSVPAPHHYVEALMRQIRYPDLRGHIKALSYQLIGSNYTFRFAAILFNVSQLQNEKTVSFRIMTNCGQFQGWNNPAIAHNFEYNGKAYINRDVIDVLHYGMPANENISLVIPGRDIVAANSKLELFLQFGGETSPVKESRYIFALRPLQRNEKPVH